MHANGTGRSGAAWRISQSWMDAERGADEDQTGRRTQGEAKRTRGGGVNTHTVGETETRPSGTDEQHRMLVSAADLHQRAAVFSTGRRAVTSLFSTFGLMQGGGRLWNYIVVTIAHTRNFYTLGQGKASQC